jgi:hypothetical protein
MTARQVLPFGSGCDELGAGNQAEGLVSGEFIGTDRSGLRAQRGDVGLGRHEPVERVRLGVPGQDDTDDVLVGVARLRLA